MKVILALFVLFASTIPTAHAASDTLGIPAIFMNHMVLQRDVPCNIWGWSKAGTAVTVLFNGQEKTVIADADGNWSLKLTAMPALDKGKTLVVKNKSSRVTFEDVVVGDVWICGGQSNMGVGVDRVKKPAPELWDEVVNTTDFPNLRYMNVRETYSPFVENQDITVQTAWTPLSKEIDLARLRPSGIGFFFARRLHRKLNVPIGFVRSNIGGSGAEAWMSMKTLRSIKTGKVIVDTWAAIQANYSDEKLKQYVDEQLKLAVGKGNQSLIARWKNQRAWPKEPTKSRQHPNTGFNGMIAPITKFTIKGIIWDQGESNAGRAWQYRKLMPLVVSDWRKYWQQGNGKAASKLPFYQVQIQDWHRPLNRSTTAPSTGSFHAEIRDAQRFTANSMENCEIVVTIDHHEGGNTHPLLKNIPGERLAAVALSQTYQQNVVWRGPTLKSSKVEGNRIHLTFHGIGQGLMVGKRQGANVNATSVKEPLDYFAIAGKDRKYVWAKARIKGSTVVVWSDNINKPKHVRYAWEGNPETANLYNKDGWPATPFRTDDLPYSTEKKEEPFKRTGFFSSH